MNCLRNLVAEQELKARNCNSRNADDYADPCIAVGLPRGAVGGTGHVDDGAVHSEEGGGMAERKL